MPSTGVVVVVAVAVIVLLMLRVSIKIAREYQRYVVFRLGRSLGQKGPGVVFLIPITDRAVLVDLREAFLEIPAQTCITRDNAPISIDFLIYWKVFDAALTVIQVGNFAGAAQGIATTGLRAVIGNLSLDDVLAKRDQINQEMRAKLDEVTERWGVKVTTVEIREVTPPKDVQDAMTRQMSAERTRRALVTEADGTKQAAITIAEGEKQAAILRAEGERQSAILSAEGQKQAQILAAEGRREAAYRDAEARERSAEAEAKATTVVSEAIGKGSVQAINYFVANNYVGALKALAEAKNQKVLILPLEASSVIGAIAGVSEIAREAFGNSGGGNSASPPESAPAKPQVTARPRAGGSVPSV